MKQFVMDQLDLNAWDTGNIAGQLAILKGYNFKVLLNSTWNGIFKQTIAKEYNRFTALVQGDSSTITKEAAIEARNLYRCAYLLAYCHDVVNFTETSSNPADSASLDQLLDKIPDALDLSDKKYDTINESCKDIARFITYFVNVIKEIIKGSEDNEAETNGDVPVLFIHYILNRLLMYLNLQLGGSVGHKQEEPAVITQLKMVISGIIDPANASSTDNKAGRLSRSFSVSALFHTKEAASAPQPMNAKAVASLVTGTGKQPDKPPTHGCACTIV